MNVKGFEKKTRKKSVTVIKLWCNKQLNHCFSRGTETILHRLYCKDRSGYSIHSMIDWFIHWFIHPFILLSRVAWSKSHSKEYCVQGGKTPRITEPHAQYIHIHTILEWFGRLNKNWEPKGSLNGQKEIMWSATQTVSQDQGRATCRDMRECIAMQVPRAGWWALEVNLGAGSREHEEYPLMYGEQSCESGMNINADNWWFGGEQGERFSQMVPFLFERTKENEVHSFEKVSCDLYWRWACVLVCMSVLINVICVNMILRPVFL